MSNVPSSDKHRDEILKRLLDPDTRPPDHNKGTFLLEVPPLSKTFIYDVYIAEGIRYYVPDPCNPDAPDLKPRAETDPHPNWQELEGLPTEPQAPTPPRKTPPKPTQKQQKRLTVAEETGKTTPLPFAPPSPPLRPRGANPGPKDALRFANAPAAAAKQPQRRRYFRPDELRRVGVDPDKHNAGRRPLMPRPPERPRRKGKYGYQALCDDGVVRNIAEFWFHLFQVNELLEPENKLEDEELLFRIKALFPTKQFKHNAVTSARASFNAGRLACQQKEPRVMSRRYVQLSEANRVLIVNSWMKPLAYMLYSDPPDALPRYEKSYHHQGPLHERLFRQWQDEQPFRREDEKARIREKKRLELERKQEAQQSAPASGPD